MNSSCFGHKQTAKVAVTTHKASGIKMAVKAITTYTEEFGSMVSVFEKYIAQHCCSFQSHDRSLPCVSVECQVKPLLLNIWRYVAGVEGSMD